jgi:hypothetical protein
MGKFGKCVRTPIRAFILKPPSMNWFNEGSTNEAESPPLRFGLPMWEGEFSGHSLENRTIQLLGEPAVELPIRDLRIQFLASRLASEHPAIVTTSYCQQKYFCGECTVGQLVAMWEAAPIGEIDRQDCTRMIREFDLPEYQVTTKAQYSDLRDLYNRCDHYYRLVFSKDSEFKRFSKTQTKHLVFALDQQSPGWEQQNGDARFLEELSRRVPKVVRSEAERKASKERRIRQHAKWQEKWPLVRTRNALTDFPHKKMLLEVQALGKVEIRDPLARPKAPRVAVP